MDPTRRRRLILSRRATGSMPAQTAVLDRMSALGVSPDATREGHLRTFIDSVFTAGGWTKMDLLYLLVGHADAATRINLVNPGTYDLTKVNTPTFTADGGWTSAASSYLDSGFNPSTAAGRKLAQDDVSYGFATLTDAADSNNVKALGGVANMRTMPRRATGGDWIMYGGSTTVNVIVSANTGKGLYGMSRSAAGSYTPQKNGVAQASVGQTSTAPTNANFLILTSDGTNLTSKQVALGFVGQAISDAEHTALWNAYVAFMTAIGSSAT